MEEQRAQEASRAAVTQLLTIVLREVVVLGREPNLFKVYSNGLNRIYFNLISAKIWIFQHDSMISA